MIVIDTSALMAILAKELNAEACAAVLEAEDDILISAGTLAEALVVAGRRNLASEMTNLVAGLGATVMPLTHESARRVGGAYGRWGKGVHPAALNLGDCFAYVLAEAQGCGLLYVGEDFARTDLKSVL